MTKDVSKAIKAKSDQLNADDLIGGPVTIRIRDVDVKDTAEQPISVYYDGDDGKPWKPCKTASRCLAAIWGANASQWVGMHCTIYNDPTVTWAGVAVGGVRVSHMEGLDKPRTLQLAKTRGKKGAVTIQPLQISHTAQKPVSIDVADVHKQAREQAKNGREAFIAWWKTKPEWKDVIAEIMPELQETAKKADTPPDPAQDIDPDEIPM